jgi:putative ABC transport system ATP-binding protein
MGVPAAAANSPVKAPPALPDRSAATGEAVVVLTDVTKTYRAGRVLVPALRGISFGIRRQSFSAIIGPSGSGKSTLLNIVGCIDTPTTGRVEVNGEDIEKLSDNALSDFRARHVGFVFQNFNLIPVLSAFENVEYPLLMVNMPAAKRREAVADILEAVGLTPQSGQRPTELSGGQKQRVAIARALVKRPEIVLADEPTANLDTANGAAIIALMKRMQAERQTTFIISTHDPQLMAHAEETFRIRDGMLEAQTARTRS